MRRGRWARGGRPAPFLPCRRKPAATGTDINAGLHALRAFAAKADLNLVGFYWRNGECRKLRKREGSGLAASIPGALDKAAVAAYGGATARQAGPAAAPAGAPGRGRGSTAV